MTGEYMLPAPVAYPPAPWVCAGGMWVGFFSSGDAPALPDDLRPFLDARWLAIGLVRYLRGPLRYDELFLGAPARSGARFGLYVHHIWVDSVPSLWGGRDIWGLPKQMATFDWQDATVRISDASGPIATLSVDAQTARLPRLPILAPIFGDLGGRRVFALAQGLGRLGRARMHVHSWSQPVPYRPRTGPLPGLALKPFYLTIPAPTSAGMDPS